MGFLFNDPFIERDNLSAIDSLNKQYKIWQDIFKSPEGQVISDNLIDTTTAYPALPKTLAKDIALTVPNASQNEAVQNIVEEVSLSNVQEQSELWDKLTEDHYKFGGDFENTMHIKPIDFWTMGLSKGGAKPGDIQYGVWAAQAYDAFWQNFGLRGKWTGGPAGMVPMLWGGMPVGRSQAYLRDLVLYDRKIRQGATKQEAQDALAIDVSFTQVDGIGEKLDVRGTLNKFVDMFQEAHTMGGETVFRTMWKEMYAGRPINFNRDHWMRMETLKPENDPRYQELITEYGYSEQQAKDLFYNKVGRPLKAYDENGEQHYTSLDNPSRIHFFAGRKSSGMTAAFTTNTQYGAGGWAFQQKSIYDNEEEQRILFSPGRYQASLFAKPGSGAYNLLSGAIDFSAMAVEEFYGGKGISQIGKARRGLRQINPLLDAQTKTIDINRAGKVSNNSPLDDAKEVLDDIGPKIDGTKPGDTAEDINDHLGIWKNYKRKRKIGQVERKVKKKYLANNVMPKIFRETKDEMLNRPFMIEKIYKPLVEEVQKNPEIAAVLMDTNPVYKNLQKSTRQKLIRVAEKKGVDGVKDTFGKLIDEGVYVGGKVPRDYLPDKMLPKGASFLTNKILIQNAYRAKKLKDLPDPTVLQRIGARTYSVLGKEDAAFRSIGTYLGSVLRVPTKVTTRTIGAGLAGLKALPGLPIKALGAMRTFTKGQSFAKQQIRLVRPKSTDELVVGPQSIQTESKIIKDRLNEALNKIGITDTKAGTEFEKYLGFSSAFYNNSDPYFRSLMSAVPDFGIKGLNKNAAYDQLVSHLQTVGYSLDEMANITKQFWKIDFRKKRQVSKFMFDQNVRDVNRVKTLGGQWQPVMRAFAKMYNTSMETATAYFVGGYADEAISMPHIGNKYTKTERMIWQDYKGETYGIDIGSAHLFSEFADNIQPFIDYRLIRRAYGNAWNELETADSAFKAAMENTKNVGRWMKYNFYFYDDANVANPYANGYLGTSKLNEDAFTMLADFYTRKLFKPFVLLRGAFFTRVFMEEQMRVVAAGLDGFFNHPIHYIQWVTSGKKARNLAREAAQIDEVFASGQLKKWLDKGLTKEEAYMSWSDENLDAIRLMDSYEYLEATQKTFNLAGMQGREQRRIKGMNYIMRKKTDTNTKQYVDGVRMELLQLRNDLISRKVAQFGYGSDELAAWIFSKEGAAARQDLADWGGGRWSGITNNKKTIDQYLQSVEARIRLKTGGKVEEGVQYVKITNFKEGDLPNTKYRFNISASAEGLGNQDLRRFIYEGNLLDNVKGKDINFKAPGLNKRQLENLSDILQESYITKGQKGKGLDLDLGYVKAIDDSADNQNRIGQAWDAFVDTAFNTLMTKPIAYLNRATVFKQYRYMYITENWANFNKDARARFVREAEALNIPKPVIDEMKELNKTMPVAKGAMTFEVANNTSKAFGLAGTKDLLYDASKRHLISDITRNIFPFPEIWFEVATTWGKLLANKPYMMRQAQVAVRGGETFKIGGYGTEGWITNNPQPGRENEKMFVYPFAPFLSRLVYGKETYKDENGQTRKVDIAAKAYLSGINLLGQGFVPGPNPAVGFALDKLIPIEGWEPEFKEFLFGGFLPPERIKDLVPLSPWLKKAFAALTPDTNDELNIEKSEFAQMRAAATISIFRYGSVIGEPRRLYDAGKMNKWLTSVDRDWELLANAPEYSQEYYQFLRVLDEAYLEYSKTKAKHLFGVQALAQFILPTGFTPTYYIEDKQGTMWNAQVLADEYRNILRDKEGNDAEAAMQFLETYGMEHGYLTAPSKVSDTGRQNYTQKSLKWKYDNREVLKEAQLSAFLILPDNPAGDRASWDLAPEKTQLTPDQFRRKVNDTLGYFAYTNYKNMIDSADLPTLQATMLKRQFRNNLILAKEGFQEDDWGLPGSVSIKDIFNEMRRVWPGNELIMEQETGKGFVAMLEQWEEFEKYSMEISPSKTKTWWLESEKPEARFMRILMNQIAQDIIAEYPDFWHVWTSLMLKFYRDDKELLEDMFDED
jgi:hypothetical protein